MLPFDCKSIRAVTLCNDNNDLLVMEENNYAKFDVCVHYIEWKQERLIWIGFFQNDNNDNCLIDQLSKDLILYILYLLGNRKPNQETRFIKV